MTCSDVPRGTDPAMRPEVIESIDMTPAEKRAIRQAITEGFGEPFRQPKRTPERQARARGRAQTALQRLLDEHANIPVEEIQRRKAWCDAWERRAAIRPKKNAGKKI